MLVSRAIALEPGSLPTSSCLYTARWHHYRHLIVLVNKELGTFISAMVKLQGLIILSYIWIYLLNPTNASPEATQATNSTPTPVTSGSSSSSNWILTIPQQPLDEFNSTENPLYSAKLANDPHFLNSKSTLSLKKFLLRYQYEHCCPPWQNLSANQEIIEELKKRSTSKSAKITLQDSDLINELKKSFFNITYLSIDGQFGDNEREKYYNFYDDVNYYLRLIKVAHNRLAELDNLGDDLVTLKAPGVASSSSDLDSRRALRRFLRTVEFRASQDPILSSFMRELLLNATENHITEETPVRWNPKFEFYEDFIRYTLFGQNYARNISIIRESILVFDQICSHLISFNFPNNFTRPSKQYEMVRRMSYELYLIRDELTQQVSIRIRSNREDLKRIFSKLEDIVESRPYIRMLGDEFSSNPPYFSSHVRQLTQLLDLYLSNSLTQVSFYDQLAELPEEFIILGSSIAHNYENKEVPQYSQFDTDYFNWPSSTHNHLNKDAENSRNISKSSEQIDPRQSNLSLLTRLFN